MKPTEQCPIGVDNPVFCSAGTCDICQELREMGSPQDWKDRVQVTVNMAKLAGMYGTLRLENEKLRKLLSDARPYLVYGGDSLRDKRLAALIDEIDGRKTK